MIQRALTLRPLLDILLLEYKHEWQQQNVTKNGILKKGKVPPRILDDDSKLTDRDWVILQKFNDLLSDFETVVRTLEGDGQTRTRRDGFKGAYGNIWDVILGFD